MDLANKIKTLRQQKGLSQQELALKCNLSLRTIQRIELKEAMPRGYTLTSIAAVLGLTHEELISKTAAQSYNTAIYIHLSALGFIVFPLLGFLFPLIAWIIRQDKSEYDEVTGRKLLNFQATWCILILIIYVMAFAGKFFHFGRLGVPETIIICILSMYAINLIIIVMNIFLIRKSKKVFYQPAIPFFG